MYLESHFIPETPRLAPDKSLSSLLLRLSITGQHRSVSHGGQLFHILKKVVSWHPSVAEMCILGCNMSFLYGTRYVLFLYGSLNEIGIYCTSRCLIITGERSFRDRTEPDIGASGIKLGQIPTLCRYRIKLFADRVDTQW